ncbi:hypothetical protein BLNAU_9520 [Blattamonas nauphoetae]|uniref:Uncharacterized protein n=1 Tax=Blattamonas nauphoetae TaxID=2049346 RepID=A0ABQ9XVF9_9EUKA|nr:hypothetical protein BLNAU_9520 [Blattamonas nauphoetae]
MVNLNLVWEGDDLKDSLVIPDLSIDQSQSSRLKAPGLPSSLSVSPSFSNALVDVCKFTLVSLDTLSASGCIQLPPSVSIIYATCLASIVSIFVESGDLVLLSSVTLDSIKSSFFDTIMQLSELDLRTNLNNPNPLAKILLILMDASNLVSVTNSSPFLTDSDGEPSEELWRAANSAVNSSSHNHDVESLVRFEEWVGMMRKCATSEEVFNDFSFLRMTCFRPTLLNLQSKYQHIALHPHPSEKLSHNPKMITSSEPTLDWNTDAPSIAFQSSFSLTSANLSDHSISQTQLEDASERSDVTLPTQPPSNTSLSLATSQQQALHVLTVLHSLITAPPSQNSATSNPTPLFHLREDPDFSSISHQPLDLNEKFSPYIFDEEDETILTHKVLRCHRLCQTIPPNQCIANLRLFVDGLVGLLESRNWNLQSAVFSLLITLIRELDLGDLHRRLLDKLRYAFREGSRASQLVLLYVAIAFSLHMSKNHKSLDDPLSLFDWDGLVHCSSLDSHSFKLCLFFLSGEFRRRWSANPQLTESTFVGFETNQNALTRLASTVSELMDCQHPTELRPYLDYSLIMSFFFGNTLPDPIMDSLLKYLEITRSSFWLGFHPTFLLNHPSSNHNRMKQQTMLMEYLCEQLVRWSPDCLFSRPTVSPLEKSPIVLLVPLIGLHSLFIRGILPLQNELHLENLVSVIINIVHSSSSSLLTNEKSLYLNLPPPLVVHFFTRPICFIHSLDGIKNDLRVFLTNLLPACAPFGECRSLAMIFREFSTLKSPNTRLDDDDLAVLQTVLDLHWLSIPVSFDSPLLVFASSLNGIPLNSCTFMISDPLLFQQDAFEPAILKTARKVKDIAKQKYPTRLFHLRERLQNLIQARCCPALALVSVVLEVMTRLVRVSSDGVRMELVKFGVLDVVVVSVSSSSFWEDFENGVALIGILLRTIQRVEQSTRNRPLLARSPQISFDWTPIQPHSLQTQLVSLNLTPTRIWYGGRVRRREIRCVDVGGKPGWRQSEVRRCATIRQLSAQLCGTMNVVVCCSTPTIIHHLMKLLIFILLALFRSELLLLFIS